MVLQKGCIPGPTLCLEIGGLPKPRWAHRNVSWVGMAAISTCAYLVNRAATAGTVRRIRTTTIEPDERTRRTQWAETESSTDSKCWRAGCQCRRCGISLPARMREQAEIDRPVARRMVDSGTAAMAGSTSRSYHPRVHDSSSSSVCQASSSRLRDDKEADRLAAAAGVLVGSVPVARIAASDALAALTRLSAILLRVTGQQVGQSCLDLSVSLMP
jgi:hypothetical protein